jgi:hypothetical protein
MSTQPFVPHQYLYSLPALALFGIVLCAIVLLSGCASTVTIRDSKAAAPSGTLVIGVRDKIGVRLDAERISGETNRASDFHGENIALSGISIPESDTLGADYDLDNATIGADFRVMDKDMLLLRANAGVRVTRLGLQFNDRPEDGPVMTYRYRGDSYGPGGGAMVGLPLNRFFVLTVQGAAYFHLGGDSGRQMDWRAGLLAQPNEHIELLAGWYSTEYINYHNPSDIEISSSGPMLNLRLSF